MREAERLTGHEDACDQRGVASAADRQGWPDTEAVAHATASSEDTPEGARRSVASAADRQGWPKINLLRMRYLINRLPTARFRMEKAMSTATRTTAPITGMPGGGGVSDPVQRGAELLETARERYRKIRDELDALRAEAEPLIDALDDPLERTVMRMRYLDGVSAREIAYRLSYSERHVFRVVAAAEIRISSGA